VLEHPIADDVVRRVSYTKDMLVSKRSFYTEMSESMKNLLRFNNYENS
jgi:hypothetical protein